LWATGPTRRYALGILAVAIAGGLLVLGFAFLVDSQVAALDAWRRRTLVLDFEPYFREVLERSFTEAAGPLRDPADPGVWAPLDPVLTRAFRRFPFLLGFLVRDPAGTVACKVGDLGGLPPPPPGPPPPTAQVRETAADGLLLRFSWAPADEDDASRAVTVEAFFHVPDRPAERARVTRLLIYGVILLGVVIYLLACLAIFMTRAQLGVLNRARERAGRLEAISKVAGGIAHEVRNPLNGISLMLQYMERKVKKTGEAPQPSDFARIHLELGKIRKVVDNFVKFARTQDLEVGDMDMGRLVEHVMATFEPALKEGGITYHIERDGKLGCTADEEKIREVLEAVITNSLESMRDQEDGELFIRVQGGRRNVRVIVRDTGDILDERQVRSIFEPYFTTRESALGLGMTVARTLVESHGGSLEAAAAQGGGCVVTLTLPRHFF